MLRTVKERRFFLPLSAAVLILYALMMTQCSPAPVAIPPTASPVPTVVQPAATPTPSGPSGTVVVALSSEPVTLDPQAFSSADERAINENVMETLWGRDDQMKLIPRLAESYQVVNDTTWRFTLRKGIKFQNGENFDATSAEYSIKRIIDPGYKTQFKDQIATIAGAKAVDPSTLEITTNGADPVLLARLYFVRMVPPKYAQEHGTEMGTHPIGTGPYKFIEWRKGDRVVLEANDQYWGAAPKIKTAIFRFIPESSTRLAALQAGEVDLIKNLAPEQMNLAPKAVSVPGLEVGQIRINAKTNPLLSDKRVRQALNYAVDKEALVANLYGGQAVVADCQMTKRGDFGYNPNLKPYPYDPAKAKQLLAEASATGKTIELVGTTARWLKVREATEAIGGQLRDVGLNVKVTIEEWQRWVERFTDSKNLTDLMYFHNDNAMFDAWWPLNGYYSEGGISGYGNPEITKLTQAAKVELDPAKREALFQQALAIGCENASHLFLYNVNDVYGISKRLEWKPRGDQNILISNMILK